MECFCVAPVHGHEVLCTPPEYPLNAQSCKIEGEDSGYFVFPFAKEEGLEQEMQDHLQGICPLWYCGNHGSGRRNTRVECFIIRTNVIES